MKEFLKGKRIIVLLLSLSLLVGIFAGCEQPTNVPTDDSSASETASAPSNGETEPSEGAETNVEGYHEVKFALPSKMAEEAKQKTTLPVTTMIKDGSLIYSLKAPRQDEAVFLGWYYDDELSLLVGPEDTVDHNMTLYPKFGLREDYEGEFSYDFIAAQDVSKNYPVLITAHNLSAEEAAAFLKVRDKERDEEIRFIVEEYGEPEEFTLESLGLDEEKLEIVQDLIVRKEGNPDYVLSEALNDQGLSEETVDLILKHYAVDEWETRSHSWIDEDSRELMATAGISENFSGVLDLSKLYGLEDGDSAARYWREELEFEPEEVLRMLEITERLADEAWNNTTTYLVKPATGAWTEGHSYEVEITDRASLRFFYNAEETIPKIAYHKFAVVKQEFNNIRMSTDMVFIPISEVQGIDSLGGLYGLVMDNEGNTTETSKRGVMTYAGRLTPGQTVAVYDGILNADNSVTGNVGYFKITEDQGNGRYAYGGADMTDVVFLPDVIPLKDDGSFDDGKYVAAREALQFNTPLHREMNLDANSTVDVGDFIIFFTGAATKTDDLRSGEIAKITALKETSDGLEITYTPATLDELHSSADMYMKVDQLDIPVEEVDEKQLESELLRKVEESNFISATSDYITSLILSDEAELPDDPDMADALKNLTFATDAGDEIALEDLRRLAGGASRVEVSKPTVSFTISLTLKHFHGKGARAVVTAGFTISIALNGNNKLEIVVAAALEQEIQLGLDIDVDTEWDFLSLEEIYVDVALKAGTFTGFGGQATVMTKEDNPSEDKEWNELVGETGRSLNKSDKDSLLNMGDTIGKMATAVSAIQEGGTVSKSGKDPAKQEYTDDYKGPQVSSAGGDLPAKYSEMLGNDAEYVDLVSFELFRLAASPDPFHLIEFSISANVKIAFKVNAMIGFSLSYGNGREFGYHIKCLAGSAKQSNDYYEKPNFRVDFFVFGMLGLRAGIELDARVGLISTKFDSIGITAEVGLYAELYGFLYMYYTWVADQGSDKGIMGSLLFEIGIYLEINFKAQIGDGKHEKEIELYSKKWPLLQLGATEVPVPLQEDSDEEEEALTAMLEIPKGKSTVKVPDAVFGIDMMALDSGEVERVSQDSNKVGDKNYDFVINGRTFTQYNEEHFDVTCWDLDGKDGKVTKNHSFQYLPATNEIYVKPVDSSKDELWGIVVFTYRNESFGFSTIEIKRTLKVHWKGDPCFATVEYYLQGANGYELVKEGSFDGFDGIEYDIMVDDSFVYQFPGYRLGEVVFPDSEKQWDVVQTAYDEMHRLYDIYQRKDTKENKDKWWTAHQYWNTLWNKANMYDWNIEQTIKNKKGTLYFLMVKNVTTVQLYFNTTTRYVPAELLYEDMPNAVRTNVGDYMTMGDNIYEKLQPGIDYFLEDNPAYQIKGDFYYYATEKKYMSLSELVSKKDEWQVLTKDMTMPDMTVYLFAYISADRPYTLSWIDRGKVIRQDTLIRWQDIPAPPETEPYPGYVHSFYSWTRDDGENLMTNSRMEARDMSYTLKWHADYQKITWEVDGETWTTQALTDELIAPTWPATYRGKDWKRWGNSMEKEGYTLTWTVKAGDEEADFNPAMKTPAGGVTLIAHYTANSYDVVWKDGNTTVKEETLEFGSVLTPPEVDIPDGTGMVWQLDGQDLTATTTLPGRDVTISTLRHVHEWTEDRVIKAMNCNTEGELRFKCTVCGTTKNEKIAIDPEAHNWNMTSFSIANCESPRIDHYTCANCNARKDVEVGEKDPGRHIAGTREEPAVAATCGKDGKTKAYYCNGCGALVSGGQKIPATGNHNWTVVPDPAPTCTTDGVWKSSCSVCGATKEETAPAIGHDWWSPSYSWAEGLGSVTAERICKNDNTHKETETVITTSEVTTPATCTSTGLKYYYAEFTNQAFKPQSTGIIVEMIPHIWGEPTYTWSDDLKLVTARRVCQYDTNESHVETETVNVMSSITTEPGCETTGIRTYTAIFTNSAFKTQVREEVVAAKGHTWAAADYVWADDNSSVTATHVCTADGNHTESETVATTTSNRVEPECETAGSVKYTATFTKTGFTAQTKTVTLPKKEHLWGTPSYTWSADNSTVTAERVCENDGTHKETETVLTSSEVTKAATYDEKGETTYTANFTNTAFATQTKTVDNIDQVPEEWNAPTYVWADNNLSVTATRIRLDNKKTETETATATGTVTTPATCEAKGITTYTSAAFNNSAFTVQTKTVDNVPALNHAWGTPTYTWAQDNSTVVAERICANDASHKETETAVVSSEVTKEPTFDAMGETTYTANFTNSAFATQTKTLVNIDKLPEGWNAPTYTWAEDNLSVTAKRVRTDGNKEETETVTATGTVTTPATCEAKGITTYTSAAFENSAFTVQTKTVDNVPALNHAWGTPTYTWAEDNSTVVAERICANDGNHKETETAVTSSEVTKAATYDEKGETTYTANFTNAAFATQTKTVANIDQIPEEWNAPTYVWAANNLSVTATRVRVDNKKTETETVTATGTVTTAATCEAKGITTYTSAAFTNSAFTVQTKVVDDVPALGHDWSEVIYTWASDNSSVTAKRLCGHDVTHVQTEKVDAAENITAAATCQAAGTAVYTATFTNEAFAAQTKTVTLPLDPDAHVNRTVTRTAYLQEPEFEGSTQLMSGWTINICTLCGYEEIASRTPVEPTLLEDEIDFYGLADASQLDPAAGKTLQDVMDKLGDKLTAYIYLPSNPNGTGYTGARPYAEYTWAENYSNVLLSDLDAQFTANPDLHYTVKVHIKPVYSTYNGHVYEGILGNGLSGSLEDLKEVTLDVDLIAHTHSWQEIGHVDHTDTEDGYYEYKCSTCQTTKRETEPAGHDWQEKWWLDDGEEELEGAYAVENEEGAFLGDDGKHYDLHLGGMRYYCPVCGAVKVEAQSKITPEYPYWMYVLNTELIDDGYATVWDVDVSRYMQPYCYVPVKDGGDVALAIPGTFAWSIGQQSTLKSITLESLKDPENYGYGADVDFTPADTDLFESVTLMFTIENYYSNAHHTEHEAEATMTPTTIVEPGWNPQYNTTGGWVGGVVYDVCSICGEKVFNHYIIFAAYVKDKINGTITAGDSTNGTHATIRVTASKLIEKFTDKTVGFFAEAGGQYTYRDPWYQLVMIYYSEDGTETGEHFENLGNKTYASFVTPLTDLSTVPVDTKLSELTETVTIDYKFNVTTSNFAPVTITLVIEP